MNITEADSKETEAAGEQDDKSRENTMTPGKTRGIIWFRLYEMK